MFNAPRPARASVLLLALSSVAGAALAATPPPSARYALGAPDDRYTLETPAVDRATALAEDAGRPKAGPLRYALTQKIRNVAIAANVATAGEWRELPGGMLLWRLPVHAPNALTLDFGFEQFFLPPGAQLFIDNDGQMLGPYDDGDNPRNGRFWTPLLRGDRALIEVLLPRALRPYLRLELGTVHAGYRDLFRPKSFFDPGEGSGACNIDTICTQGDAWRSEINAEAILVMNGGFCSGQLLNNTRGDRAPLLSTANHCIANQFDADGLVVYWKYESPVCRAVDSSTNAQPVPTSDAIAQLGGATFIASYAPADFTLVRLNTAPPPNAHAHWNGWDRSETAFSGAAVMHHPQADAKRISFSAGSVTLDDLDHGFDVPGTHHWRVDHYALGTTEEGSSGSGLLDAAHRLRGVLSGGAASCTDLSGDDYYGRLSSAWNGGGSAATSMRAWLDPLGSQPQALDGTGSCSAPNVALAVSANPALAGAQVTISASASGGTPPYTYAFDVDGDGAPDNLDRTAASLVAAYPGAFAGNIGVTVTDQAGCSGRASRALIVQAQSVVYEPSGGGPGPDPVVKICGSNSDTMQPGERFSTLVHLRNNGNAATSGGYAVFAQDTGNANAAPLTLETPAVALPALAPGAETALNLTFAVAADAACGAPVVINYLGTADDNGFTSNPAQVVAANIAPAGRCQPQACAAQVTPIALARGNFLDPLRPGNGMAAAVVLAPQTDPLFFGAWFTGDAERAPTWYVVNERLHANQLNGALYQTHQSIPGAFPVPGGTVGAAQVTLLAPDRFVYTWTLNGASGGAIYRALSADPAHSQRAWFDASESGWGTFDEVLPASGSGGRPFLFNLAFLYDAAGTPRWTTASDASYGDGKVLDAFVARPACPGCVWLDYTLGAQAVGTLRYDFTGGSGSLSTAIALPAAYPGTWQRNALPIVPLIPTP